MNSIADLVATVAPEPMGRKHDDRPEDRKRHLDVAVDHVLHGMTAYQIQAKYRIGYRTVYRYIEWAATYEGTVAEIIRRAMASKQKIA